MKRFKKITAMAVAATMLVSSGLTVLAEGNEGSDSGSGEYEGYVDKTSVFSVKVPTSAANVFDFFVDPNGLLAETDYARFGDGVSATDFESGASLFFTRTVGGSVTEKYGKDSNAVELVNMSSYEVDVQVTASIEGADGITFSNTANVSSAQDPTLYLAIVSGDTTKAITTEGGMFTGTISGNDANFEIQWDSASNKYVYKLIAGTTEDSPTSPWGKTSFNLTGACGGIWTEKQAEVSPVVTLTWKVTDPYAQEAPSLAKTEYEYVAGQTLSIPVNLGLGDLAATKIATVEYVNGTTKGSLGANRWSFSNGKLNFSGDYLGLFTGSRTHIITFDDAAKTKVEIVLTPWKTDVAPSIATTTYEYVGSQDLVISVDLGRGNLAATSVATVDYLDGGTKKSLGSNRWSYSGGTLTFPSSYLSLFSASRTHVITFDDAAKTEVQITLEPKK